MTSVAERTRTLVSTPLAHLVRPQARLQPILAKQGDPNIDLEALRQVTAGVATLAPTIAVESPEHWARVVRGLGPEVDGILPVSIAAYPTEIWNSHPQPLVERGLPFVFWSILKYNEPDFWRWSATDFLRTLGVKVFPVQNNRHGLALLRALGLKRQLATARMVVFGEQNFPWNATVAGHFLTDSMGIKVVVRPLADIRALYGRFGAKDVQGVLEARPGRYKIGAVRPGELEQAVKTYLAIKTILEEEQALGFGVNCFGDLIIKGGRDVPCLAQTLLREDGYIASCDGDYPTMLGMAMATYLLDKPCLMSNMYPVQYVGALKDHFGDPLAPASERYGTAEWKNLARLAHCGFVGVVSPEMSPEGAVTLQDWGGTYEIKRDGRGCGIDGNLAAGQRITIVQPKFDGRTLNVCEAEVAETSRHPFRHCESSALLRFRNLEGFVANISREHIVVVYGDHAADFQVLSQVLGLTCQVF